MIAACQENDRVECLQRKGELFAKKRRVVCKENDSCLCSKEFLVTPGLLKTIHLSGLKSIISRAPSSRGLYGTNLPGSTPKLALTITLGWKEK